MKIKLEHWPVAMRGNGFRVGLNVAPKVHDEPVKVVRRLDDWLVWSGE